MAQRLIFLKAQSGAKQFVNTGLRHAVALSAAALLCISTPIAAKNLGSYGETWEIAEENLLDVIYRTLKAKEAAGDVAALQRDMTKSTRAYVNRPTPVSGITKAQETRSFLFDPSITVEQDLKDHRGVVFARKGQVVNPLDYSSFSKRIVMIDGDDPDQVAYALKEGNEGNTLIVMVNGAPLELTKKYQRRFWFDQDGVIVKRFGVQVVPTVITRQGREMLIREVALDG